MKTISTLLLTLCFCAEIFAQCNAFYPIKENVKYEYEMYDKKEKLSTKMTHAFKDIKGSGDNMSATLTQELFDAKKGDKIATSDLHWKCENGILHFDMKSMNLMMDNTQQMNLGDGGMSVDVTGDQLDLPSDLSVGQTLKDVSYNIKMTMGTLTVMNRTYHIKDRKVESQENLTTPAGTFDCYKVTFTTTDDKGRGNIKSALWYAKDAGLVKSENYDDKGKMTARQILTAVIR
jgi:hypothetical protein